RVYAEKDHQDWTKVINYCKQVEGMGFTLEPKYGDLWGYDDTDAKRNSVESICEITWSRTSGNWYWMMFHRNAYNPDDSFTWTKWITPSRSLIAAYDAEGDTQRKNASIATDACSWSHYYPGAEYKFMHKVPTNASSWIMMRLGEIYLLHAEALAMTNQLSEAAAYVNKVRNRAGLKDLPSSASASQSAMLDAVLNERRLELSFEGFRFFDLVRHDKAKEVHDAMYAQDSYWQQRTPLTDNTILMPVPQVDMDENPSLTQNEGY
ncbi:MAG: RagB/SusD family nutrient uptake outer membrane protein, partial [Bacteroidales bacterium]